MFGKIEGAVWPSVYVAAGAVCSRHLEVSRIFTTNDGFAVITTNESHADGIFNNETKHELATHDFVPVMPPELNVIISRTDDIIFLLECSGN